jgi:hypothetical protein
MQLDLKHSFQMLAVVLKCAQSVKIVDTYVSTDASIPFVPQVSSRANTYEYLD